MAICNPSDLPTALTKRSRLMAFDVGTKTIGIAVSDPGLTLASPIETIRRSVWSRDVMRIEQLVHHWNVGGFVVGLALNMNDSEGPSAQRCRAFARNLLQRIDLPLSFWDERLSSYAAEEEMRAVGVKRRKREAVIDQAAAANILQDLLERLRAEARHAAQER